MNIGLLPDARAQGAGLSLFPTNTRRPFHILSFIKIKQTMKSLICLTSAILLASLAFGQEIVKSSNEKISGKAAAGKWVDYSINPNSGDISFTFETKSTKKKSEYETYSFDQDLNFSGVKNSEYTAMEAAAKFEVYMNRPKATKLLRVGKNLLTGQMKLELGRIEYGYAGRAVISSFITESKVKPKGEDGSKLLLIHSRTENPFAAATHQGSFFGQTRTKVAFTSTTTSLFPVSYNVGDVLAVVYEKTGRVFQDYAFLVYDAQTITRKLTKKISFDHAYRPLYVRDMPNGDMAMIFASVMPQDVGKAGKMGKLNHADKPTFKYLRINTKGETVVAADFELPKNKMGVQYQFTLIPATDPEDMSTYLVGYGNPDFLGMGAVELAASQAATHGNQLPRMTNMTAKKLNTVVLGKFSGKGKVYLNTMSPAAFWKNGTAAKGSKVMVPTADDASKFFLSHLNFLHAGTINGRDYLMGVSWGTGTMFTAQLDGNGAVEARAQRYIGEKGFHARDDRREGGAKSGVID